MRKAPPSKLDGIGTFMFQLGSALIEEGHNVEIIGIGEKESKRKEFFRNLFGVKNLPEVSSIPKTSFSSFNAGRALNSLIRGSREIRKKDPDLLILNSLIPILWEGIQIDVNHTPYQKGSWNLNKIEKVYRKILYRRMDKVITVSSSLKQKLKEVIPQKKISVIPPCINTQRYKSMSWDKRENLILHIGTSKRKNFDETLRAFRLIENKISDINLYLVGSDTPYLREEVEIDFSNEENIQWLGEASKEQLVKLLSKAKVVSFPSKAESFGYVAVESLSSGTPLVGSKSIPKQLIEHNQTGYRVNLGNHKERAKYFTKILRNDELGKNLSRNCENISKKYDSRKIAKRYIHLYKSLQT